jgi:hypothetical protein
MPIRKLDISHLDTSGAQYGANLTYVASNARFEWVLGTYVLLPNWASATESKLVASDAQASDFAGTGVEISADGSYAVVSAGQEDGGAGDPLNNAGAAYVYVRSGSTWTQQAKLTASDAQADDLFGYGISATINSDGTYVIVGSPYEDTGGSSAGAAYVFTRSGSTWTQQQKIVSSDLQAGDQFGWSVSINSTGTYAIVGARLEDTNASNAGAVYIFTRSGSTWTQQAKIVSSDGESNDQFGYTVSMSSDGSYAIVSAYLEDGGAGNPLGGAGAAYVFSRSGSTWTEQAILRASDSQASDQFGDSVSINSDGTYAIVGAKLEDGGAGDPISGAGAAYVFSRSGSTWTEQAILRASDAQANDNFGQSVSINSDGTYAIVGAPEEDGGAGNPISGAGAVYVFSRSGSTWTEQAIITASDAQANDRYGSSVSINGDGTFVITGVPYEGDGGTSAGAAYIYEVG